MTGWQRPRGVETLRNAEEEDTEDTRIGMTIWCILSDYSIGKRMNVRGEHLMACMEDKWKGDIARGRASISSSAALSRRMAQHSTGARDQDTSVSLPCHPH